MRRHAASVLVLAAALTAGLLVAAQPAAATTWAATDPVGNIVPSPPIAGSVCDTAPQTAACTTLVVAALDNARRTLKLPAYKLPAKFVSMKPVQQLLTLTNLDRAAYHLPQVQGLNSTLDAAAATGVRTDSDPPVVKRIGSRIATGYSGNWAGGSGPIENISFAYYEWMYDDGPGSTNIDCTAADAAGCWVHRHDTLNKFPTKQILMGASTGPGHRVKVGWAAIYESFRTS